MSKPEVLIDGVRLSLVMPWGDLEWTTCWPGGTESIQFGVSRPHALFRPGALVELDYGGIRLTAPGSLVEPTRGEPLVAEGLHRKAEEYAALDAVGEVATGVHQAVDQAVMRGMPLARGSDATSGSTLYDLSPEPLVRGMPHLDPDRPHSVAQYLDQAAVERGQHWGVAPDRRIIMADWEETPSLYMLPGVEGLARSRDGYASVLHGRYNDIGTGTYRTSTAADNGAIGRWGRVERTVSGVLAEGAPITASQAHDILAGLLLQGRSQMGWSTSLEVQHGEVVNQHNHALDLNRVHGRQSIRLQGLSVDVRDLSGRTWVDAPVARTHHKGSSVTLEFRGLSSPMNDALAGVDA